MSNIFIRDIDGVTDSEFDVPEDDTELAAATTGLDAILTNVTDFRYDAVVAWVETKDGGSAPRTLNCLCQSFEYDTGGGTWVDCPSTAQVQTLTGNIKNDLELDEDITSIGEQQVSIFQLSSVQAWIRDPGGFVYPTDTGDDVYVGGGTPNSVWKSTGELYLGASGPSGLETLRVPAHPLHEVGTLDAVRIAGPVVHVCGGHELPTPFKAGNHDWTQIGAGGVDRRRVTGRTRSQDEQAAMLGFAHSRSSEISR